MMKKEIVYGDFHLWHTGKDRQRIGMFPLLFSVCLVVPSRPVPLFSNPVFLFPDARSDVKPDLVVQRMF